MEGGGDESDRVAEEKAGVDRPPPDLRDPVELDGEEGEDIPARVPAEHHDHLRPDDPDLLLKIRGAGPDLLFTGVAVPGRPVLDDVRDEDIVTR